MEKPVEEPFSRLTDDLTAEILSRVPYKSLRICERVCPPGLARRHHRPREPEEDRADPGRLLPHRHRRSTRPRASPSATPTFPPSPGRASPRPDRTDCFFSPEDSSDGLFLTRVIPPLTCSQRDEKFLYMVSNPATGDYFLLPHSGYTGGHRRAYLGFDGDAPTQEFHAFEFVMEKTQGFRCPVVTRVNIYSSETGAWVARESQWNGGFTLRHRQPGVFRKGCLHLLPDQSALAMVDAQGLRWRTVPLPTFVDPSIQIFIGKSAGKLLYIDSSDRQGRGSDKIFTISVYALSVGVYQRDAPCPDDIFVPWEPLRKLSNVAPRKRFQVDLALKFTGVHPHANIIFLVSFWDGELIAYDLDHHESTVVYHIHPDYERSRPFLPYVSLLSRLPEDGGMQLATLQIDE
ncbi:hypothetical protein CFC21_086136 [Triticum aestivum]|uniref:DUF1618 domain-containing protein n=2 Tax=Triticum aestivum TaxID=4565 RepID=A0A9R1IFF0_WHEAT|nr:hypothetical protein CFC21_086136 [Triticum aestivum]